ncbi:hypothetical protein [Nocardia sp. NPDC003183]
MTDPSNSVPDWAERLEKVRSATVGWYDWLSTPDPAEPSSALLGDDRIHAKEPVRNAAWLGLIAATDHLGLMVDSLSADKARPVAHFTLARASLFAAARTVWILSPSSRRTRQERALWVLYDDTRNLMNHIEGTSADAPSDPAAIAAKGHVQSEMDDLKQLAQNSLGLTLNKHGRPSDTTIVSAAAGYLDPTGGNTYRGIMMSWRVHSGHAHGLSWPNLLKRPTQTFVGPDGRSYHEHAIDYVAIAGAVAAATTMTNKAFALYQERASSHLTP